MDRFFSSRSNSGISVENYRNHACLGVRHKSISIFGFLLQTYSFQQCCEILVVIKLFFFFVVVDLTDEKKQPLSCIRWEKKKGIRENTLALRYNDISVTKNHQQLSFAHSNKSVNTNVYSAKFNFVSFFFAASSASLVCFAYHFPCLLQIS